MFTFEVFLLLLYVAFSGVEAQSKGYVNVTCAPNVLENTFNVNGFYAILPGTLNDAKGCFAAAKAENSKYFGIRSSQCYIQLESLYRNVHSTNQPSVSCGSNFDGSPPIETYENLEYTTPVQRQQIVVTVGATNYLILNETAPNFMLALQLCTSLNKSLAEIKTRLQIQKVNRAIRRNYANWTEDKFWLNMDKASNPDAYTWVDSQNTVALTGRKQNWAKGNPVADLTKECAVMSGSQNLQWIVESCVSYKIFPICQESVPGSKNITNDADVGSLPAGNTNDSIGNESQTTAGGSCEAGYQISDLGKCIDVDECTKKPCGLGWCTNSLGSYSCQCSSGTQLSPSKNTCEDINECLNATMCIGGRCINHDRTYACLCEKGYHFDVATRTCVDIDECRTNHNLCHLNANCINMIGHYKCECKRYFVGDGLNHCRISANATSSFHITCDSSLMQVAVDEWVIKNYGPMTLLDTSCGGTENNNNGNRTWVYSIRNDLSNCKNRMKNNGTHFVYSNVLNNNKSVIANTYASGHLFSATWSCAFPTKNIQFSLDTWVDNKGTGFIDFQLGEPDQHGVYPGSVNHLVQLKRGGIIAQTVSPGGEFVTDVDGYIVPQTDAGGNIVMGPNGGRFVPVTDANGLTVTNAQGSIKAATGADGAIKKQMSPTLPPNSFGYGGVKPPGVQEQNNLDVITGSDVPGDPIVVLPNGTVLVPGHNLSQPLSNFLPNANARPEGGVYVVNAQRHVLNQLNGTGVYDIKMLPFTDNTFNHLQKKSVFTTKDTLYLRISLLTKDKRMTVVAQRCWGTAQPQPQSKPNLQLINSGCPQQHILQNSIKVFRNGIARTADFKTQVFKFDNYNATYIHCSVDICDRTKQICEPICNETLQRKRRSIDIVKTITTNRTLGPFYVVGEDEDLFGVTQQPGGIVISLVSALLVLLCLVFLVCCIACCCRRRRRRRNRRKQQPVEI